jgi:glycosyltransferase involved in cell wall biosynthesis
MKILSIVWYKILPPRYGGQKGIAGFNKYLSRHIQLSCLCSENNETADFTEYKLLTLLPVNKLQFINPWTINKMVAAAIKEKPTHVILEHPYHGLASLKIKKITGARLIVHSHNIESERYRLQGKWGWRLLKLFEKWVHRHADFNIFKTGADLNDACKKFGISREKCMIIPYCIDPEANNPSDHANQLIRERHKIAADSKILLFSGSLDYKPNAAAVENIFKEILTRLTDRNFSFRVIITGKIPKKLQKIYALTNQDAVIMTGEINDIENYFEAADVFINPVQYGCGIQTKIVDALSWHLNVVCFSHMLNGIDPDLCLGKLFKAEENNFKDFAEKIFDAAYGPHEKTPDAFFNEYSFAPQTEKLAARLKSI